MIVFISHKLNEVMHVADRVTVLRLGKVTAAGLRPAETTIPEQIGLLMTGGKKKESATVHEETH